MRDEQRASTPPLSGWRSATAGALLTLAVMGALGSASAQSREPAATNGAAASDLARANRAFDAGETAEAEEAYAAVLAAEPDNTRALYRLAELRRRNPQERLRLLEQYVALVPRDAWGHLAHASALGDAGRASEALEAYERALALEPADRDIALGGPRLHARLGDPELAIAGYRAWLARHDDDGEAWREMADQLQRARRYGGALRATEQALRITPGDTRLEARRHALRLRTAPAIDVGFLGIGETDVSTVGGAIGADMSAGEGGRIGVSLQQRRMTSLGESADVRRLLARLEVAPRAGVQIQASGGVVWSGLEGTEAFDRTRPEALFRLRRRPTRPGLLVDLRAQHGPVDVTPQLAADELVRSQVAASLDAPLGRRLHLRGSGRIAAMSRPDERNIGTRYGGGLATVLAPATHLSAQWQQSRYQDPAVGYFAPKVADTIEAGLDFDLERGSLGFALDAGAGMQRVQKHPSIVTEQPAVDPGPVGPPSSRGRGNGRGRGEPPATPGESAAPPATWGPALRAWGLVSWSLRPGRVLMIELETYDSLVGDAVIVSEHWRYASVSASFRVVLP